MRFNHHIQPICLPNDDFDYDKVGRELTLAGFGETEKPKPPDKIQFANVVKLDSDKCFKDWEASKPGFPEDWSKMKKDGFCSRGQNGETNFNGDSGGATIWNNQGKSY